MNLYLSWVSPLVFLSGIVLIICGCQNFGLGLVLGLWVMGPVGFTLLMNLYLDNWDSKLLAFSSLAYGVFIYWAWHPTFDTRLDPQAAAGLAVLPILALPHVFPVWILVASRRGTRNSDR